MREVPEHPGVILRQVLEAAGMSQVELSRRTGLSAKHVNQLCQGLVELTPRTAILLEEATGVDAGSWMLFQSHHALAVAREQRADEVQAVNERVHAAREVAERALRGFSGGPDEPR